MVCLILLGHLWTCSGCVWPPHSGSVYIEVSVSMTAVHTRYTCTLIWTLSPSWAIFLTYYILEARLALCSCRIWLDSCYVLLLKAGERFNYIKFLPVSSSWTICRGPWMCKLWRHLHPSVATGWYRPLPVQRLWPVPQDERPEPTTHQAQA